MFFRDIAYHYTTGQVYILILKHLRETPTRLPQISLRLPVCNGRHSARGGDCEQGKSSGSGAGAQVCLEDRSGDFWSGWAHAHFDGR